MKHRLILLAVLAAAPALAAPAPIWTIDKSHSQVAFSASMNGQPISGRFSRFDARIAFDPGNLSGSSVTAVIDTASAATGDKTRDEALPTPDWFNVRVFPRATFTASRFKALGGGAYQAIGTLTIRGRSQPAVMPFRLMINGSTAEMKGSLTIDRRSFGVGQGQFASPETVAAGVRVNVSIRATRR